VANPGDDFPAKLEKTRKELEIYNKIREKENPFFKAL
jgi:hypothetical protein